MARGESMRVTGTPTLFLDGKKLDLSTFKDPASIKTFLDRVLAE
jgi:protein-disulfide isomerase